MTFSSHPAQSEKNRGASGVEVKRKWGWGKKPETDTVCETLFSMSPSLMAVMVIPVGPGLINAQPKMR